MKEGSPQFKKTEQSPPITFEPLTKKTLEEALGVAYAIFPYADESPEDPGKAFAASLEPEKYKTQLEELGIDSLKYWTIHENGKLVGVTGVYHRTADPEDVMWGGWTGVVPSERGKGLSKLGYRVFERAIEQARSEGVRVLRLYTSDLPEEATANRIYDKLHINVYKEESSPEGYTILYREKRFDGAPPPSSIERILEKSKFTRSNPTGFDTILERGGERFSIEAITSSEHPDFMKSRELLIKIFQEEEIDPEDVAREIIDSGDGQLHVVRDSQGEVVVTALGNRLDLSEEGSALENKQVFMVSYIAVDETRRREGLAREAYISMLMKAAQDAEKEGKELSFAAGECTYTSERFWNDVGWKRMYTVDVGAKKLQEIQYVQPPLDFDPKTGVATADAGEAPEHLMIDSFERLSPSKDEIITAVRQWYDYICRSPEDFTNRKAYKVHEEYFDQLGDRFEKQITDAPRLTFLTERGRDRVRARGFSISEYTFADGHGAGKEDF